MHTLGRQEEAGCMHRFIKQRVIHLGIAGIQCRSDCCMHLGCTALFGHAATSGARRHLNSLPVLLHPNYIHLIELMNVPHIHTHTHIRTLTFTLTVRLPSPSLSWLDATAWRVHVLMPFSSGGCIATAVHGLSVLGCVFYAVYVCVCACVCVDVRIHIFCYHYFMFDAHFL
jgi:hypothetical protein